MEGYALFGTMIPKELVKPGQEWVSASGKIILVTHANETTVSYQHMTTNSVEFGNKCANAFQARYSLFMRRPKLPGMIADWAEKQKIGKLNQGF